MGLLLLFTTAAAAPRVELGAGVVGEFLDLSRASVEAIGRVYATEHLTVELSGRVPVAYQAATDLDQAVIAIAYEGGNESTFVKPVTGEPAAITALADWGFEPRPTGPGLTGGLHLVAGPEGRLALDSVASVNPAYAAGVAGADPAILSEPTVRFVVGAAVGFGMYAHIGERVSIRVILLDHLAFEPERAWDDAGTPGRLRLTSVVTTSTDVLVAF